MAEPDYEALGRYVHLCEQVKRKTAERAHLLERAATVLQHAARPAQPHERGCARKCNFEAMEKLLGEAKAADAELLALVEEANALAPLADRPELGLA
ncbi:conserved hypothetical protein [Pseudomonas sp. OF001]|uniref:hypothetical protein n=1 Tax=Pseudomonas sp. OF001 TaxID=2772300 RepID=UPI00191B1BDB|nr:hypothetical protein [Pseudomonas sp. OF001]CAD5377148.1 conserved hypothetical protein [Pseudomonas sp. OF001]